MNLSLALYAVSQRPTDHDGPVTRIWQRDLGTILGLSFGPTPGVYRQIKALAAVHPDAVFHDPGRIGPNLSVYLSRSWADWAPLLPGMTEDDALMAAREAGYDDVAPLSEARALPDRMVAA